MEQENIVPRITNSLYHDEEEYLSPRQAADRCGWKHRKILDLIRKGILRTMRISSQTIRIPASALDRLIRGESVTKAEISPPTPAPDALAASELSETDSSQQAC